MKIIIKAPRQNEITTELLFWEELGNKNECFQQGIIPPDLERRVRDSAN